MFGYVMANQEKLSAQDKEIYHGYYCGVCRRLYQMYGRSGQLALNFDLTFVALVLSGLYDTETVLNSYRCPLHPSKKRTLYWNDKIDYACDMTILLTYLKCEDNWEDDHQWSSRAYQKMLSKKYQQIHFRYPQKVETIENALKETHELEKQDCHEIDALASLSGKMMGEIMCLKDDEWKDLLYEMGDYLGRFIYIMDAYEDVEKDIQTSSFNPFKKRINENDFDKKVMNMLELMMAGCSNAFEKLPILDHINLLRNILYSGVWAKYEWVKKKRVSE